MLADLAEFLRSRSARRAATVGIPAVISRLSRAVWGVLMVLAIKVLAEDIYAALAVSRSVYLLSASLGGVFSSVALVKFMAEGHDTRETQLANASIYLSVLAGFIIFGVLYLCSNLIDSFYSELEIGSVLRVCAFAALVRIIGNIPTSAMLARHRTTSVMIVDLSRTLLSAALLGYLLVRRTLHSAEQVILAQMLGAIGAALLSYIMARRDLRLSVGTTLSSIREVLLFSMYSAGTSVIFRLYSRIDILMLGRLSDPAQVAAYGASRALTEFLGNIYRAGTNVVLPLVSRLWNQGRIRMVMKRTLQGIVILSLLVLPGVLVMTLFPTWVLDTIFEGKYSGAGQVLAILSALTLVRPALTIFSAAATGIGKPTISFQSTVASAILNAGLNFLLIPRFGGVGAAVSTVVAVLVGILISGGLFTRQWKKAMASCPEA